MPFLNVLYEPHPDEATHALAWRLLESGQFPTLRGAVPLREIFAFAVAVRQAKTPKRKGRRTGGSSQEPPA